MHLSRAYGDRAYSVAKLAKLTGKRWPLVGIRLHEEFPYLEAEILYAVREYACTAVDVIGRRLRLAFLNTYAAEESLPKIVDLMAQELGWDRAEKEVIKYSLPDSWGREVEWMPSKLTRHFLGGGGYWRMGKYLCTRAQDIYWSFSTAHFKLHGFFFLTTMEQTSEND